MLPPNSIHCTSSKLKLELQHLQHPASSRSSHSTLLYSVRLLVQHKRTRRSTGRKNQNNSEGWQQLARKHMPIHSYCGVVASSSRIAHPESRSHMHMDESWNHAAAGQASAEAFLTGLDGSRYSVLRTTVTASSYEELENCRRPVLRRPLILPLAPGVTGSQVGEVGSWQSMIRNFSRSSSPSYLSHWPPLIGPTAISHR